MKNLKNIFFDLDHTIWDFEKNSALTFEKLLKKYKVRISLERFLKIYVPLNFVHPIVIAGCDSRFEYDLNREPERAIYEDAWGKKLWHEPLPKKAIEKSLEKHHNFYRVVDALIRKIEDKFSICIVYDMHSYNWKRWDREVPTWNLGTSNVDRNRFVEDIDSWRSILEKTPLPNRIKSTSKINDTFYGNGYFLKHITNKFHNTLVLATEISKVYCDELEQIMYPEVVHAVENYLKEALKTHANSFYAKHKS